MKNTIFFILGLLFIVTTSCSSDDDNDTQQITLSQTEINDLKVLREE